jgi:hypothetical protein
VPVAAAAAFLGMLGPAGCRTENMREMPRPCRLAVRWADGGRIGNLILVSINGLPFKSLTKAINQWERSQTVALPQGSHVLVVRLPKDVVRFEYYEVRRKTEWTIRVQLQNAGAYTAFLDPDSDEVTATSDEDGSRVDVAPPPIPAADQKAPPSPTNAPSAPFAM